VIGSGEITSGPYAAVVGPPEGVAVGVAPPEAELVAVAVGDADAPPPELAVGVGVTPPGVEEAFTAVDGYGPTVAP